MLRTTTCITLCLLACHVAACSTLSTEERAAACASTDWQRYGENDGRLGVATSDRANEFQTCADLGKPVDLAAYQTGRSVGLQSYCTVENGYRVGYEGRRYDKVCPTALEPDFLQGFDRGRAERPKVRVRPTIGIGIGNGGVRGGVGIGVGTLFGYFNGSDCTWGQYCD